MSFHYLDDFITIGSPNSTECERNIEIMKSTCKGLPVEEENCEGPATYLTFLGIKIDTVALELRLPSDKLYKLRRQLKDWRGRKVCTKSVPDRGIVTCMQSGTGRQDLSPETD